MISLIIWIVLAYLGLTFIMVLVSAFSEAKSYKKPTVEADSVPLERLFL